MPESEHSLSTLAVQYRPLPRNSGNAQHYLTSLVRQLIATILAANGGESTFVSFNHDDFLLGFYIQPAAYPFSSTFEVLSTAAVEFLLTAEIVVYQLSKPVPDLWTPVTTSDTRHPTHAVYVRKRLSFQNWNGLTSIAKKAGYDLYRLRHSETAARCSIVESVNHQGDYSLDDIEQSQAGQEEVEVGREDEVGLEVEEDDKDDNHSQAVSAAMELYQTTAAYVNRFLVPNMHSEPFHPCGMLFSALNDVNGPASSGRAPTVEGWHAVIQVFTIAAVLHTVAPSKLPEVLSRMIGEDVTTGGT
ncbi:hypothetical protein BC835DRAFT_1418507 [Cytidiella melzeri]|nr:hypothetical protein BC835DRAFT_1419642 [Cytidiella melzeri]KAI0689470.1 hypothetical protein BC835DRAFT_1418507 [Cytidiella melzeri]